MPHESLTFNGVRKDWLYIERGRKKPPFAARRRNLLTVSGYPGAYLQSTDIEPLTISQPVGFRAEDDSDALTKKDELAEWLITDEPVALEFDDEPGRVYYAVVQNSIDDFEKISMLRSGTITFICPDPYAYGPEQPYNFPSDYVSVPNNGTHEAKPVFELEVLTPVTFAMIQNQNDEYMMIGTPTNVDTEIVDARNLVLEEDGGTLNTWNATPTDVDGQVSGSMGTDGNAITVVDYGTGSTWHGPALIKEVPTIQDFEVEMFCEANADAASETFRIEFYLFDEGLNVLGKMAIWDNSINLHSIGAEGRYGPFISGYPNYAIKSSDYRYDNWDYFYGLIRLRRVGNTFEFYVARLDQQGNHYFTLKKSYRDTSGSYAGKLKYVQVHIGTHSDKGFPGQTGSPYYARINYVRAYELTETTVDQTPYIAYPGDVITFDHKKEDILLNGENVMRYKDFGAKFFELQKEANELVVHPSNAFNVNLTYRETFK